MEEFPMTRQGYDKLRAELEYMEKVEMPAIVARIAAAREEGDLSENAEYHGARESQGLLEAKMGQLRYKLSNAKIIDKSEFPSDEVVFGSQVRVYDEYFEEEVTYTIVGAGEEDFDENKILVSSPLAQGLLGKKVGDVAQVDAPAGIIEMKILEIIQPE